MPSTQPNKTRPPLSFKQKFSQDSFTYGMQLWKTLPVSTQTAYNLLSLKMQQAGLRPAGAHQSGCNLFMQMNRAVRTVYNIQMAATIPTVPTLPPALPPFTLTATQVGAKTTLTLSAPAYATGCQVWCACPFIPGIRDPFAQRMKLIGTLPQGWPDGMADLSPLLAKYFRAPAGYGLVVKIVPVSPEGFLGPSLSELCIVGEAKTVLSVT